LIIDVDYREVVTMENSAVHEVDAFPWLLENST